MLANATEQPWTAVVLAFGGFSALDELVKCNVGLIY